MSPLRPRLPTLSLWELEFRRGLQDEERAAHGQGRCEDASREVRKDMLLAWTRCRPDRERTFTGNPPESGGLNEEGGGRGVEGDF